MFYTKALQRSIQNLSGVDVFAKNICVGNCLKSKKYLTYAFICRFMSFFTLERFFSIKNIKNIL